MSNKTTYNKANQAKPLGVFLILLYLWSVVWQLKQFQSESKFQLKYPANAADYTPRFFLLFAVLFLVGFIISVLASAKNKVQLTYFLVGAFLITTLLQVILY